MLRKLFHKTDPSASALGASSWDDKSGFPLVLAQLDEFEDRLKRISSVTARHCQALSELGSTTNELHHLVPSLMGLDAANTTINASSAHDHAHDLVTDGHALQQTIETSIARIRSQTLAPIQMLLSSIPQLRLRSEHRKSSMNTMLRYQKKLELLRPGASASVGAGGAKHESTRVQRNRAKLHAATTRFKELDESIRNDITKLLNAEIASVFGNSLHSLHQAQTASAEALQGFGGQIPRLLDHLQHVQSDDEDVSSLDQKQKKAPSHSETSSASNNNQHSSSTDATNLEESIDNFNSVGCLQPDNELSAPPAAPMAAAFHQSASVGSPSSKTTRQPKQPEHPLGTDNNGEETTATTGFQIMPKHLLDQNHAVCAPKKHVYGTKTWKWHQFIKDSLASGLDVVDCVRLPEGCQVEEWIAVHVIDFFNEISLLFGTVSEFCTLESCPEMTAGPCYTYLWADGIKVLAPITLPACEYIAKLMTWIEEQLDDPNVFPVPANSNDPTKDNKALMESYRATGTSKSLGLGGSNSSNASFTCNANFVPVCKVILKRLFRVYAHMYHNHLDNFVALHVECHLNFCFKRFVFFVKQFDLIDQKELNALRKLIVSMQLEVAATSSSSSTSVAPSTTSPGHQQPSDKTAASSRLHRPQLEQMPQLETQPTRG